MDLVGVPYAPYGRSTDTGLDCYGLVLEVAKRAGWSVRDPLGEYSHGVSIDPDVHDDWEPCTEEDASVVLMSWDAEDDHIGVIVSPGRMIHARARMGVVAQRIPRDKVRGWYRPKHR